MLKLAQRYAQRDEREWAPLFYRILQSRIRDWYRRSRVRNRWRLFSRSDEEDAMLIGNAPGRQSDQPDRQVMQHDAMEALDAALRRLPLRQQQVLLLRLWEGLSVADTARAMKCAEGSVKTHYSRAVHALRDMLEEHHV